MKKQTTLQLHTAALSALGVWLNSDNSLFSNLLENTVSNRQVLLIGHAVLAFSVLLCCGSSIPALVCLAWFAWSLSLCRKGGLK